MKIGLVRHFKVDMDTGDGLMNIDEYNDLVREYDISDVIETDVDLREIGWNKVYASDMKRAIITARTIYKGDIIQDKLIREVDVRIRQGYEDRSSYMEWSIHSLIGWAGDRDYVCEKISDTRNRVNEFLDKLLVDLDEDDKVLLVCHGLVMRVIKEELEARGFTGEDIIAPKNGDLYLIKK